MQWPTGTTMLWGPLALNLWAQEITGRHVEQEASPFGGEALRDDVVFRTYRVRANQQVDQISLIELKNPWQLMAAADEWTGQLNRVDRDGRFRVLRAIIEPNNFPQGPPPNGFPGVA